MKKRVLRVMVTATKRARVTRVSDSNESERQQRGDGDSKNVGDGNIHEGGR